MKHDFVLQSKFGRFFLLDPTLLTSVTQPSATPLQDTDVKKISAWMDALEETIEKSTVPAGTLLAYVPIVEWHDQQVRICVLVGETPGPEIEELIELKRQGGLLRVPSGCLAGMSVEDIAEHCLPANDQNKLKLPAGNYSIVALELKAPDEDIEKVLKKKFGSAYKMRDRLATLMVGEAFLSVIGSFFVYLVGSQFLGLWQTIVGFLLFQVFFWSLSITLYKRLPAFRRIADHEAELNRLFSERPSLVVVLVPLREPSDVQSLKTLALGSRFWTDEDFEQMDQNKARKKKKPAVRSK